MNYILVAYYDERLGNYFLDARADLNNYILQKGKNVLNNITNDCNALTFKNSCVVTAQEVKNYVFFSHGSENSLVDSNNESFINLHTELNDYNINTFYSVACDTAKGNLRNEIIKTSNLFFGYNDVSYVAMGGSTEDIFIECDNYAIKNIISNNPSKPTLIENTEDFFRVKINELIEKDCIVEAAFLMHNKEAIEIH